MRFEGESGDFSVERWMIKWRAFWGRFMVGGRFEGGR